MFPASLADSDFRRPTEAYYAAVLDLAMRVLEILAKGLPYGDDIFHDFVSNDPVCIMRLLHYPPPKQQADNRGAGQRQLGAGAHTDFGEFSCLTQITSHTQSLPSVIMIIYFYHHSIIYTALVTRSASCFWLTQKPPSLLHPETGAITLLLQDTSGGLEVQDPHTQAWHAVAPNRDAYVVNIGDMLALWTKGIYRSAVHRVINVSGGHRYSVPFFFDGNAEAQLRPFDGSEPVGGRVVTVEEHMLTRLGASYRSSGSRAGSGTGGGGGGGGSAVGRGAGRAVQVSASA